MTFPVKVTKYTVRVVFMMKIYLTLSDYKIIYVFMLKGIKVELINPKTTYNCS